MAGESLKCPNWQISGNLEVEIGKLWQGRNILPRTQESEVDQKKTIGLIVFCRMQQAGGEDVKMTTEQAAVHLASSARSYKVTFLLFTFFDDVLAQKSLGSGRC